MWQKEKEKENEKGDRSKMPFWSYQIMLLGALHLSMIGIVMFVHPTMETCAVRVWLWFVGGNMVISSLNFQTVLPYLIIETHLADFSDKGASERLRKKLLFFVCGTLVVVIAIVILYLTISPPHVMYDIVVYSDNDQHSIYIGHEYTPSLLMNSTQVVSSDQIFIQAAEIMAVRLQGRVVQYAKCGDQSAFVGVLFTITTVAALVGVIFVIRSRTFSRRLRQQSAEMILATWKRLDYSLWVGLCLQSMTLFAVIVIPLMIVDAVSPQARFTMFGVLPILGVAVILLCIYLPRFVNYCRHNFHKRGFNDQLVERLV